MPPELNWEHMEDGILQKMAKLQMQQEEQRDRTNWARLLGAGALIAVLLLPLLCTWHVNISTDAASSLPGPVQVEYAKPEGREAVVLNSSDNVQPATRTEHTSRNHYAAHPAGGRTSSEGEQISAEIPKLVDHHIPPMEEPNRGIPATDQSAKQIYTPLPLLPLTNPSVILTSAIVIPTVESVIAIPENITTRKNDFTPRKRLVLLGGLSAWSPGYGQDKPERHPYEKTLASGYAELSYIHPLNGGYLLMAGLQYHQLESRFDWSQTIDDYKLTLTDTIIGVTTNALTGKPTVVYGDVTLSVKAQQTVRHYNTTRILQVPVAIGKTWRNKSWQADVLVGGAAAVWTQNNGLTRYQGALLSYSGSKTALINTQWNINGLLKGRLTRLLSDRIGVTAGAQFQKSLTNWSAENGVRMHPNVLSFELGLSCYLK
ncbi:MAG: hypothetical protein SFV52_15915 [Saprospiraceae bacterium]|nr:hypothetical protein [Saprospiraceae bacterium]